MHTTRWISWPLILLLSVGACTSSRKGNSISPPPPSKPVVNTKKQKSKQPGRDFQPAISLSEKTKAIEWLKQSTDGSKMLRLPIRVSLKGAFPGSYSKAFLGHASAEGEEPFPFKIDDSRMGIPMSTFLGSRCGKEKDFCTFWLEGTMDSGFDSRLAFFVRSYVSKEQEPATKTDWIWEAI